MRIGELSKMYGGIDKRTIDFYTSKGLLVGKPGKNSKYRDYDQEDVERLGKILIFREMGLSINDIEAALDDDSYWTPARLDQHIAMLKENQAREYERYEQMIQFAQTMKATGMSPLGHFKEAGIQADKYAAFWVNANDMSLAHRGFQLKQVTRLSMLRHFLGTGGEPDHLLIIASAFPPVV